MNEQMDEQMNEMYGRIEDWIDRLQESTIV